MHFDPDAFPGNPYGHLTNQAGHAYLVGAPLALALSPLWGLVVTPAIVAVCYWIIWERIIQRGRDWRDSFEDAVHVMAGASVMCAALSGSYWAAWGCLAAQGALLAVGVARRIK
jgi:hypothetical protein